MIINWPRATSRRTVLGSAAALAGVACGQARPAASAPAFPLRVAAGGTYLEDSGGRPFLLQGDTAWSLIVQLRFEEAENYLQDRRARGFNSLLVNLIEHKYAARAPANIYGDPPFVGRGGFSDPNEAYFAHADRILRRTAELGFLVLLAPAYIGYGGGDEGWYRSMLAAGPSRLRAYGDYVGRRFGNRDNIMWVHAGDFDPPERSSVLSVAEGILRHDRTALNTAHCAPETAAAEFWGGQPWLNVDTVYTYQPVYRAARRAARRRPRRPYFLIESTYENEHGVTEERLRTQAYQALLNGAFGQVFGNNPIWHFGTPGREAPMTWRQALDAEGSRGMQHLVRLFERIPWWQLEPDLGTALLPEGAGEPNGRQSAARTRDGRFALVHTPEGNLVTLDPSRLAAPIVQARWFDPSDGSLTPAQSRRSERAGWQDFAPPGRNRSGSRDWILEISAHAR